jgi:sucrose-phosphate synthase
MIAADNNGLYLVLISVHGLVRGHNLELGRDSDTGGQTKYVIELARALAGHPDVERVDLLTRQVIDPKVDKTYAEREERLADNAYIIRIPCGPRRYLRKEVLWPYLDAFIDNAIQHIRHVGRTPDIIHSHYADAGWVGSRLCQILGIPLVHTGHSLGRVKKQRLLDSGLSEQSIERQYNIGQRIEAEEITLGNQVMVVASTSQEVEEQYSQYENYHAERMVVIAPGVDLERFHPPARGFRQPHIAKDINRFLADPKKPMIFALSRPDPRKNIHTLVQAYAENPDLRARANLVVVAGNRDDIQSLDKGAREVLQETLYMIDRYDLYGQMAFPKHHEPNDVPDLYRIAAHTRGVFINPALTEPFGLTLIEAAASGLPIFATNDGGPRDIISHCRNGSLIDPMDSDAMGEALLAGLKNRARWKQWSRNGIKGTKQHYTWEGHANKYIREVNRILGKRKRRGVPRMAKSRLPSVHRLLVCDIDNTLLGDAEGLHALLERLDNSRKRVGFAVATGRRIESAVKVLKEWDVPTPDIFITSVGSEIHYGNSMAEDLGWQQQIDYRWNADKLHEALAEVPGLRLQPKADQRRFKLSYFVDPDKAPPIHKVRKLLRQKDLHAKLIYSHDLYLDLLPVRASKGLGVRYLAMRWNIPLESIMVAGDSGNDEEMLQGNTLGVVVNNYCAELEKLKGKDRVYFADGEYAWGILEGIEHYNFVGNIR